MKVSPTTKGPRRTTPAPSLSRRPASPWNSDRKSTRLNSSHSQNSDAVFCLNKKPIERTPPSEFPIHLEIYRARADVGAVAHFHALYPTALAVAGMPPVPPFNTRASFSTQSP